MMERVDRFAVEQAYAFFHQKEKVYVHSTSEREKDHIEDSISSYVNSMSACSIPSSLKGISLSFVNTPLSRRISEGRFL